MKIDSSHARFGEGTAELWLSTLTAPLVGVDARFGEEWWKDGVVDGGLQSEANCTWMV